MDELDPGDTRSDHGEMAEVLELMGTVEGRTALIVDDFTASAGTLVEAARVVSERGATAVYAAVTVWGSMMQSAWEFYVLAIVIGLVQGGVQALSRSFYTRLIPSEQAAELFGFYNMVGKSAAVIGPVMMGWITLASGSHRFGILSLLLLFAAGFALLLCVRVPPDTD